jgi:hypothetical protein
LPLPERVFRPLEVDAFGCVELPGSFLARGATYTITSVPLGHPGSSPSASAAIGTRVPRVYLAVPFDSRRVAELARRVTAGQRTPEQKLAALIEHLQGNYLYTLNAPAIPRGRDAADYFIFHQKRGYCDLFATSLALMARAVDIPTRVVTGFLSGAPAGPDQEADYLLRDADRHAWVEAYLPELGGWVTLDATPGGSAGDSRPRGLYLTWLRARFFLQDHPETARAALLLLLAAVAYLVLRARWRRAGRDFGAPSGSDAQSAVIRAYRQFLLLLRRRGLPRRPSQTPLEYLQSLSAEPVPAISSLGFAPARQLTQVFLAARYGPGPVTEEQLSAAQAALAEVVDVLRRPHQKPQ